MNKTVEVAVAVEYQGFTWVGEWVRYAAQAGRIDDRYLVMSKIFADVATPVHQLDLKYTELNTIRNLITSKRVQDIQCELGLPDSGDELTLAENILQKAWSGEWMGQAVGNHEFEVEDLARILGQGFPATWLLVTRLTEQGKVKLDGHLIKPCEEPQ